MVLLDLVSGVVAVNATGHADSLFISDFIILDICRSVLQVFLFSYQCNNFPAGLKGHVVRSLTPTFPHGLGDTGIRLSSHLL